MVNSHLEIKQEGHEALDLYLCKQANSPTNPLNKPDCLKLSIYNRHWFKVKERAKPILQKNAHIFIYLTVFINFCTQIFYKFYEIFP